MTTEATASRMQRHGLEDMTLCVVDGMGGTPEAGGLPGIAEERPSVGTIGTPIDALMATGALTCDYLALPNDTPGDIYDDIRVSGQDFVVLQF